MKVVELLVEENVAHNLFLTRGTSLEGGAGNNEEYDSIRVIVWAREFETGGLTMQSLDFPKSI